MFGETGPLSGRTSTTVAEGAKRFLDGTKSRSAGDTSKATAFENLGVGALLCEKAIVAKARVKPTLRDAIGHLQSVLHLGNPFWPNSSWVGEMKGKPCQAANFPEGRLKYYRMLKEGQNWRNLPKPIQREAMGASWFAGGGRTGFYRRLAWDKPSPTLVTSPTMPATDLCHPAELRPLSVEEYAAIQTFQPGHVFIGKLADQYRQIGNAVPCLFGEAIARHLLAFDEGHIESANLNGKMSRYIATDHTAWRESVTERQLSLLED